MTAYRIPLALLLSLCAGLSFAAEATMRDALNGTVAPQSVPFKEMATGWYKIHTAQSPAESVFLALLRAGGPEDMGQLNLFHYTKGQTVTIEGQPYLIAYLPPAAPLVAEMQEGQPRPQITRDTPCALCLLHLPTAGSLSSITPMAVEQEVAALNGVQERWGFSQIKARQTESLNNLKQFATAFHMFAQDHEALFPKDDNWAEALAAYLDPTALLQPGTKEPYLFNTAFTGKPLGDIQLPAVAIIAYEATPWPDGRRAVAFCDGHVELVSADRWPEVGAKGGLKEFAGVVTLSPDQKASVTKLRQLAVAVVRYAGDHNNTLPAGTDWKRALDEYAGDPARDPFRHPLTHELYRFNTSLAGKILPGKEALATTIVAYETTPWLDGSRCVAFLDGNGTRLTEAQWRDAARRCGIQ